MNILNKLRKVNSGSAFGFSTLYTKLPHYKLLMVPNNLIHSCFDEGENKYITVSSYGAR